MIGYGPVFLGTSTSSVGNIIIQDPSGFLFNDLTSAVNYINSYSAIPISNASFAIDTIRFSVPKYSDFNTHINFLSLDCRFIDALGYIRYFPENFLNFSTYDNIIGDNSNFNSNSLNNSSGDNIIGYNAHFLSNCFNDSIPRYKNIIKSIIYCEANCFVNYTGVLEIHGDIGPTNGQDFPNDFFLSGTNAIIVVRKSKQTSNNGGIDGDLVNAIKNGATVLFILP